VKSKESVSQSVSHVTNCEEKSIGGLYKGINTFKIDSSPVYF